MHSFYGNIKNNSRVSFIFDKIYETRKEMDDALRETDEKGILIGDGVYNGRYVLIDYGERYTKSGETLIENTDFANRTKTDLATYFMSYNGTVWQKYWEKDEEKYILVGNLNAMAPQIEVIPDAPYDSSDTTPVGKDQRQGPDSMNPHMDIVASTDLLYKLHIPQNWNFEKETEFEYNKEGFNKYHQSYQIGKNNITLSNYNQDDYPDHSQFDDNGNQIFYETVDDPDNPGNKILKIDEDTHNLFLKTSKQYDSKQLNLDLKEIGNLASDIWDLIFPFGKLVKYEDTATAKKFLGTDQGVYYKHFDLDCYVRAGNDEDLDNWPENIDENDKNYYYFEYNDDVLYTKFPLMDDTYLKSTYTDNNNTIIKYSAVEDGTGYDPNEEKTYYTLTATLEKPQVYLEYSETYLDSNNEEQIREINANEYLLSNSIYGSDWTSAITATTNFVLYPLEFNNNKPMEYKVLSTTDFDNTYKFYDKVLVTTVKPINLYIQKKNTTYQLVDPVSQSYNASTVYYIKDDSNNYISLYEYANTNRVFIKDQNDGLFILVNDQTYQTLRYYEIDETVSYRPLTIDTENKNYYKKVNSDLETSEYKIYKNLSDEEKEQEEIPQQYYIDYVLDKDEYDATKEYYSLQATEVVISSNSFPSYLKYFNKINDSFKRCTTSPRESYDSSKIYYVYKGEAYRDTFIGNNRDPGDAEYPQTLAEAIRYINRLIGLKTDNQFEFPDIPGYDTLYGVLNGAKSIFGNKGDKFSNDNFRPIRDNVLENQFEYKKGLLSYAEYTNLQELGMGPFYFVNNDSNYMLIKSDTFKYQPVTYGTDLSEVILLNNYYYLINEYEYIQATDYDETKQYYIKQSRNVETYEKITDYTNLVDYTYPGIYYYKTIEDKYVQAQSYDSTLQYYEKITTVKDYYLLNKNVTEENFANGTYYYRTNENTNYAEATIQNDNIEYYLKDEDNNYVLVPLGTEFEEDKTYYYITNNQIYSLAKSFDENKQYYTVVYNNDGIISENKFNQYRNLECLFEKDSENNYQQIKSLEYNDNDIQLKDTVIFDSTKLYYYNTNNTYEKSLKYNFQIITADTFNYLQSLHIDSTTDLDEGWYRPQVIYKKDDYGDIEFKDGEETIIVSTVEFTDTLEFIEDTYYYDNTQYYRDFNTLWGYYQDFKEAKENNYVADWIEDQPDSLSYIKNKPEIIFQTYKARTEWLNEYENKENTYELIIKDDGDSELTQDEYNYYDALYETLFQFDENIQGYVESDEYNPLDKVYYTNQILTKTNSNSIEERWRNKQLVDQTGVIALSENDIQTYKLVDSAGNIIDPYTEEMVIAILNGLIE